MSKCKACDRLMSEAELCVDSELCSGCLDSVNEEFIEDSFADAYEERRSKEVVKEKYKKNST